MSKKKDNRYQSVQDISRAAIVITLSGKHASSMKTFKRGETLIHKDSGGNEAYIIVSGKVEIFKEDEEKHKVLDISEKGQRY